MGTISEEMKKVMEKWNASAIPAPATETQTETQPKGNTVKEQSFPSYRAQIHDFITKNPKATTATVLDYMQKYHPTMGHSSISSQLSVMFQDCLLTRDHVYDNNTQRNVYGYTAVSLKDAEKLRRERDKKLALAQARMEKARQAKAEKARAKQITLLNAPTPQIPLPFDAPTVADTAPVSLSGMTAMQILQGINFAQAKELYKELKEAFGG